MSARTPAASPIAILTKTFPKLSETFVLGEIRGLERRGHALRIYALAAPDDEESQRAARAVRSPLAYVPSPALRDFGALVRAHAFTLLASPSRYLATLTRALAREESGRLRDFARAGWLANDLRRERVAHLHTHFVSEPAGVAELASWMSGIPYSLSAHAKDIYLSTQASLRRKLTSARFTVTCTDHNRAHLATVAPNARVLRMYHGVDTARLSPAAAGARVAGRTPLILSVGRLRAKKGFATLIDALARLRADGVAFRAQIVGYGPEHERLAAAIAAHRLGDAVELTGKLGHDEVIRRYGEADLFVLPCTVLADGDRDGIPNVLLEAMAMALPVVSTSVSGIPELVVDDENGLLVAPDDALALSAAMLRLLGDATLRARLGAAARATVMADFTERNLDTLCGLLPGTVRPAPSDAREAMHARRI